MPQMTWKQFVQQVESALDSNGIDINAQPVHIDWIDFTGFSRKINLEVNTKEMPKSCEVRIGDYE